MESYLKFLEDKVDRIIKDMTVVYILKKEIKEMKEEGEVIKNLLFGSKNVSTLTSEFHEVLYFIIFLIYESNR